MRIAFCLFEILPSDPNTYHIVLLDWNMQGQDWVKTAEELSEHCDKKLRIIIITGGEEDELETITERTCICGFISKPLFRSSLYYGLRHFMEA